MFSFIIAIYHMGERILYRLVGDLIQVLVFRILICKSIKYPGPAVIEPVQMYQFAVCPVSHLSRVERKTS